MTSFNELNKMQFCLATLDLSNQTTNFFEQELRQLIIIEKYSKMDKIAENGDEVKV